RDVITNCQMIRRKRQAGTWITEEMLEAYTHLHELGFAHSVETWQNGELVGGLYGISLGKVFFGESMFAKVSNASKIAYISLVSNLQALDFELIDCQVYTEHLESLGAVNVPREEFMRLLAKGLAGKTLQGNWAYFNKG
ncbi:MAG: leucyl/phenylalanyl-tRNA--protein transferase, partial [Thermoflexibacter sp.]|nr:leucyl/phenylalanyl-tRNA--protein transferase [Thermoflexibacter sp.]